MPAPDLTRALWVKSSHSNNGGNCVEWAPGVVASHGVVPIRDSKNPDGPALTFDPAAWRAFVSGVTAGDFPALYTS